VLTEDKAEATILSYLYGKEARHGAAAWRRRPEERRHRGGEMEETTLVGLT
jgi:hypothetical protein